jgi:hypothetical protein
MSLILKNESVHGLYVLKGYILDLLFGSSPTSIIQKPKEGAQKPARCVWEWGTSQRNTSKNDDEPMNVVFFHSKLSDMSRESHHRQPGCGDPPVALHLQDASQAVPGPS